MARFENEEFVEVTDKDLKKATDTTNTENTVGDETPTEKLDETPKEVEKAEAGVVIQTIERGEPVIMADPKDELRNASVNVSTEANEKKGLSIAGLVLGIINVFGWLFSPVGVVTGIVGIVLSAIAIKKENKKGMSITGLVLSIIGLVVSLIFLLIACVAAMAMISEGAYYGV